MMPSSSSKDKFYEKVTNPYLLEEMKYPQTIEMREGVHHIRNIQGQKMEERNKAMLGEVESEIFKCQGMIECELSPNQQGDFRDNLQASRNASIPLSSNR
ncbi:40S ribosomal protein S5-1 [Hordeum vulgare]|nr:40S ribosomal protein S5-1 [Hordeum vulgare]